MPDSARASWPSSLGDAARANRDTSWSPITPPVSIRGTYQIESFPDIMASTLVDGSRIYLVSAYEVAALERQEGQDLPELFDISTELWRYRIEEPGDGLTIRRIGSSAIFTSGSMAALVPQRQMLVFLEEELNFLFLTLPTTWIVGLDLKSGEEVWRYELPGGFTAAMNVVGTQVHVRYEVPEDDFDPDFPFPFPFAGAKNDPMLGRFIRIGAGDDAPAVEVEIETPGNNPDLVHGSRWYMMEGDRLSAFRPMTLERLWSFPAAPGTLDDYSESGQVQNMVAGPRHLYFTLDEDVVMALHDDGRVAWRHDFPRNEDCPDPLRLSLHREVLVVSGYCGDTLAGLDPLTGDLLWQESTLTQVNIFPVVIAGDALYYTAATGVITPPSVIMVHDVHTGEPIQTAPGFLENTGFLVPQAATGGYLFALTTGTLGSGDGRLALLETEPAELVARFHENLRRAYECGVPQNTRIGIPVDVVNMGPGISPDTGITIRAQGGNVLWEAPPGLDASIGAASVSIRLGELEAFGHAPVDLFLTPLSRGEIVLETTLSSEVRIVNPSEANDALVLNVVNPVPENLDLSIAWVEATQGIQDRAGSIGLVAGKPTLLRVYPQSNVPVTNVQALMRVTFDSPGVPNSQWFHDRPVQPLESCLSIAPGSAVRDDLGSSFNFLLPPDLLDPGRQGPFKLEFILDPDNVLGEANRANNNHTMELRFETVSPICLVTHRVRSLAMGGGSTYGPWSIPQDHIERGEAMLPAPAIHQMSSGNTLEKIVYSFDLPPTSWGPYELDPGGSTNTGRLLATLFAHSLTTFDPRFCKRVSASVHHVGVVAEDNLSTRAGSNFNGYAWMVEGVFTFRVRTDTGSGFNLPKGGTTMAHELGHTFRRFHVNCGNPAGAWSSFPHPNCQLGPLGDDSFFGMDLFDPLHPVVIPPRPGNAPRTLGDLMSYADDTWTSDYTWNGLKDDLGRKGTKHGVEALQEKALRDWLETWKGEGDTYLLVSATIAGDGTAVLEDVIQITSSAVPEEKALRMAAQKMAALQEGSPWAVELAGGDGTVILSVPVEVQEISDTEPLEQFIGTLVPLPDGVAEVRLVHADDGTRASAARSANAPVVTLNEPQAGSVMEDFLIVDWTATDADGEPLVAMIQYSDDDGESWTTLAVNAPDESYIMEADLLPGAVGTARIRVIVSDGFNSAEAVSGAFTVPPRAPTARITRPADGQEFALGEPVLVRANAYDPEDGPLLGESLLWEVEGIGPVGLGEMILLQDLPVGTHRLILTATDSDGEAAVDEVFLVVGARPATSAEIAAVLAGLIGMSEDVRYDLNEDVAVDAADVQRGGEQ